MKIKDSKNYKMFVNISLVTWSLFIVFMAVFIACYLILDMHEKNELNRCYTELYNVGTIGKGCHKYFEKDAWYDEYIASLDE